MGTDAPRAHFCQGKTEHYPSGVKVTAVPSHPHRVNTYRTQLPHGAVLKDFQSLHDVGFQMIMRAGVVATGWPCKVGACPVRGAVGVVMPTVAALGRHRVADACWAGTREACV